MHFFLVLGSCVCVCQSSMRVDDLLNALSLSLAAVALAFVTELRFG